MAVTPCPRAAPAPGRGAPVPPGCRVTGQPWPEGSFSLCLGRGSQLDKFSQACPSCPCPSAPHAARAGFPRQGAREGLHGSTALPATPVCHKPVLKASPGALGRMLSSPLWAGVTLASSAPFWGFATALHPSIPPAVPAQLLRKSQSFRKKNPDVTFLSPPTFLSPFRSCPSSALPSSSWLPLPAPPEQRPRSHG